MKHYPLFLLLAMSIVAQAGEQSLFNGKDLEGWEGNPKLWSVEEGAITGRTAAEGETKLKHNTFLVWKAGTVGDFELTFRYRIESGNSGVQYRSQELPPGGKWAGHPRLSGRFRGGKNVFRNPLRGERPGNSGQAR